MFRSNESHADKRPGLTATYFRVGKTVQPQKGFDLLRLVASGWGMPEAIQSDSLEGTAIFSKSEFQQFGFGYEGGFRWMEKTPTGRLASYSPFG